jgi:hypothetical protein
LTLHGIAPWSADAVGEHAVGERAVGERAAGDHAVGERAVAYFRPDPFPGAARDWWLERA